MSKRDTGLDNSLQLGGPSISEFIYAVLHHKFTSAYVIPVVEPTHFLKGQSSWSFAPDVWSCGRCYSVVEGLYKTWQAEGRRQHKVEDSGRLVPRPLPVLEGCTMKSRSVIHESHVIHESKRSLCEAAHFELKILKEGLFVYCLVKRSYCNRQYVLEPCFWSVTNLVSYPDSFSACDKRREPERSKTADLRPTHT